jgi:thioredoxin reductase/Fe-S-cluster-containing hydrogenase component 2/CRP-like cAMP-binding protein
MTKTIYRVAIIGAGPAGLSAAARAAEKGMSHILLESAPHLSNTIHRFQKGKHVMAEPIQLPLRSALEFAAGSRETILDNWTQTAARLQVNVRCHAGVKAISGEKGNFSLRLADGATVHCETVVIAIGLQGKPNQLGVPGEEFGFVSYQLDDPDEFDNASIVVIGAGDSAIENAIALAEQNQVIIVNRRNEFSRAKPANLNGILRAINGGHIECHYHSVPVRIEAFKTESGERAKLILDSQGTVVEIICDRIIARLGAAAPRAFLESCGVNFCGDDPAAIPSVSPHYESNVSGLYIVGALIGSPLIKQALNQGFEVIEAIAGTPVQAVEETVLLDKFDQHFAVSNVDSLVDLIRSRIPLFSGLGERQIRELMLESSVLRLQSGATVFRRNDYSDSFFCILQGGVSVHLNPQEIKLETTLHAGEFFGETELVSGRRRSVTVEAPQDCILLETPRQMLKKLASFAEPLAQALNQAAIKRAIQWYLAPEVSEADLASLLASCQCRNFAQGDALFHEGEVGDSIHFIRGGSVSLSHQLDGQDVAYRFITSGDYVGEWAVLTDSKRIATARATSATETVEIQGAMFKTLLKNNPELRRHVHLRALNPSSMKAKSTQRSGDIISFLMQNGVGQATDVLLIDESKCIRCDNCEKACAETHQGVSRLDREAGPTFASIHVPTSCRHCIEPHCMKDCPPNALHRSANGEIAIADTCIGCGNCVENCPFGVIHLAESTPVEKPKLLSWLLFGKGRDPGAEAGCTGKGSKKAVKCDMCSGLDGGPACVSACPTGAALRFSPEKFVEKIPSRGI